MTGKRSALQEIRYLKIFYISVIFLFASISLSIGVEDKSGIDEQAIAEKCLEESTTILEEMEEQEFLVQRINDSIKQAESLYKAQITLKEKRSKHDFSLVLPYCSDIKKIKDSAYNALDEFSALKKFYHESFYNPSFNTESVDLIISEIDNEMKNERYEMVSPLVDKAYEEMINVQAAHGTAQVFLRATTRGVGAFFEENWKWLSITLGVLIIISLVYKKTISRWIVKRKINFLELRKKTLKGLVQQAQKDYFQYGKISEGTFRIKIKKLAELIRDIDRQIPLLQEELIKLSRQWTRKVGKRNEVIFDLGKGEGVKEEEDLRQNMGKAKDLRDESKKRNKGKNNLQTKRFRAGKNKKITIKRKAEE